MATIYKRKGSTIWQIEYTGPSGKRLQRSSGTRDEKSAKELAAKLEYDAWRQARLKERPRRKWQEAVTQWLSESAHKRSLEDDKMTLKFLHPHLYGLYLDEIDRERIEAVKQAKLETGVKAGTVNRMLAVLRAILNRAAREWGWMESAPFVKMLAVKERRLRWLTRDEAAKLLHELPPHLGEMARFTLATGLRESNVTGLAWSQIDMQRRCAWIHADQAKGNKSIAVPLNDDAMGCIRRQIGKHTEMVFTYKGKPVARCNNSGWRTALVKAGINDFRWHDLRHTWASWHIQAGTPLHVLRELGGWSDLTMVLRYAHMSPAHLAEYADAVRQSVTLSLTVVKENLKNGSNGGT